MSDSEKALANKKYEIIVDNDKIIEEQVGKALDVYKVINELVDLFKDANVKGINTDGSSRLVKLAELSLSRGDYLEAYARAKEAQVTYALEVKGEIGKLSYYFRNNPKEISLAILFLAIFSFASYRVGRLQLIRRRINMLREEEIIINQLIRLAQEETFIKKRMDMEEYNQTVLHYQDRLAQVVELLIDLTNEEIYALTFVPRKRRLIDERKHLIESIKQLQIDYLKKGIVETHVFELKMRSYEKRIGEIDSQIAEEEAKKALKNISIFDALRSK
ncbi:hypothetical protein J4217_00885 [Candidatus Pacearchaeota archaeon]|nr:hypothetical protein [Candidatus Pacearchaeota archaeon]